MGTRPQDDTRCDEFNSSESFHSPDLMSFFSSMFFTRFKSLPHTFVVELSVRSFSRLVRLELWIVTRFAVLRVVVVVVAVSSVDGVVTAVKFVLLLLRLLKHFLTSDRLLLSPPLDVGVAGIVGRFGQVFFSPTLCISFTTSILVTTERASFCCCLLFWQPADGVSLGEFIFAADCDMVFWNKKLERGKFLVSFSFINLISTHFICDRSYDYFIMCTSQPNVASMFRVSCLMWNEPNTFESRMNGRFSKNICIFSSFS